MKIFIVCLFISRCLSIDDHLKPTLPEPSNQKGSSNDSSQTNPPDDFQLPSDETEDDDLSKNNGANVQTWDVDGLCCTERTVTLNLWPGSSGGELDPSLSTAGSLLSLQDSCRNVHCGPRLIPSLDFFSKKGDAPVAEFPTLGPSPGKMFKEKGEGLPSFDKVFPKQYQRLSKRCPPYNKNQPTKYHAPSGQATGENSASTSRNLQNPISFTSDRNLEDVRSPATSNRNNEVKAARSTDDRSGSRIDQSLCTVIAAIRTVETLSRSLYNHFGDLRRLRWSVAPENSQRTADLLESIASNLRLIGSLSNDPALARFARYFGMVDGIQRDVTQYSANFAAILVEVHSGGRLGTIRVGTMYEFMNALITRLDDLLVSVEPVVDHYRDLTR